MRDAVAVTFVNPDERTARLTLDDGRSVTVRPWGLLRMESVDSPRPTRAIDQAIRALEDAA